MLKKEKKSFYKKIKKWLNQRTLVAKKKLLKTKKIIKLGHLINPIGQRMGFTNYWALNCKFFFDFNSLISNSKIFFFVKIILQDALTKITELTSTFLDGLLIYSSLDFIGFKKTECLADFTIFDYMFAVFFFDGYYFTHLKRLKKLILKIKNVYSIKKKSNNNFLKHSSNKKHRVLEIRAKSQINFFNKKFLNLRFTFVKVKLLTNLLKKKKLICDIRSNLWLFYLRMVSVNSFFKLCSCYQIKNLQLVGHFFFERNFLNAKMLTLYAIKKLKKGFSLNLIIRNILAGLSKIKTITGYKICVSGRFTRKQIATYRWHRRGILSLNYFSAPIDYSQNEWRSWFGLCGIKVWLQKKKIAPKKGFLLFFKNKNNVKLNKKMLF